MLEHNIDTIYHFGDTVERRKFINYLTLHRFREMFMDKCSEHNIKLHMLVGNHDIYFRNTNAVNSADELFSSRYDNLTIYSEATEVEFDGIPLALVPWINSTNYADTMEFLGKTKAQILFGHLELKGFEMYRGIKNDHGMDTAAFDKFDMVCSGHFHHKSSRKNINYLGSPYETNWNDYNDRRGFHIFDSETRELEFIQNPYRMFHKVFYDDTDVKFETLMERYDFSEYKDTFVKFIVQAKNNPYWLDKVLDSLYKANPIDVSIVEDNKHMDLLTEDEIINEAEDTLSTINKCVDRMETDVDKSRLSQLFTSLYVEAQDMVIV